MTEVIHVKPVVLDIIRGIIPEVWLKEQIENGELIVEDEKYGN